MQGHLKSIRMRRRRDRIPIKEAFQKNFLFFVVLPLLIIISILIVMTLQGFYQRTVQSIDTVQESIASLVEEEVDSTSLMLSSLVYANDGHILQIANEYDSEDALVRYRAYDAISDVLDYALQTDPSILSIVFRFESGRTMVYRTALDLSSNALSRHDRNDIREDMVHVTAFNSGRYGSLYSGDNPNDMIYSAVIYPSLMIDRQRNIVSVELFRISDVYREIYRYDTGYRLGRNSLGTMAIVDADSGVILSSSRIDMEKLETYLDGGRVSGHFVFERSIESRGMELAVISMVRIADIFGGMLLPVLAVVLVAVLVTSFLLMFSGLLMNNIIRPVSRISDGLKRVEDGDLDLALEGEGYMEVMDTISSFNGMVRHQRALIEDYRSRLEQSEGQPGRVFAAFVQGVLDQRFFSSSLFSVPHSLIMLNIHGVDSVDETLLMKHLDADLQFAVSCQIAPLNRNTYVILHEDQRSSGHGDGEIVKNVMKIVQTAFDSSSSAAVSRIVEDHDATAGLLERMRRCAPFMELLDACHVSSLTELEAISGDAFTRVSSFMRLADALLIADEKVVMEERERFSASVLEVGMQDARNMLLAFSLAFSMRQQENGGGLMGFFGYDRRLYAHVMRLEDASTLVVFLNNLISEIMDKARCSLDMDSADVMTRARRYIADNYQYEGLTLGLVSAHVGLNERYFSSRFTKEVGETFSSYLTGLRILKARQLLRTTTFKVYEVAAMCGYAGVENFNKAFRKEVGVSPLKFRKGVESD